MGPDSSPDFFLTALQGLEPGHSGGEGIREPGEVGAERGFPSAGASQRIPGRRESSAPVPGGAWVEGQGLKFRGLVSKRWHKAQAAGEDWACLKLKGAAGLGGRSSASVGRTWVAQRAPEMGRGLQEEGRVSGDGEGHGCQGRVTKPGRAKGLEGYGSRERGWGQVGAWSPRAAPQQSTPT